MGRVGYVVCGWCVDWDFLCANVHKFVGQKKNNVHCAAIVSDLMGDRWSSSVNIIKYQPNGRPCNLARSGREYV